MYSVTKVYGDSFAYNFIESVDTTFNSNGRDGFHTYAYAGVGSKYSVIIEKNLLYSYSTGTKASGNGRDGVNIYDNSVAGSYVISSNSTIGVYGAGITANGNGADGISIGAANFFFVHGEGYVSQNNTLYGNTMSSNGGDGLHLFAGGPGVGAPNYHQSTKLVGNTITGNTGYGIYGSAVFGAYQKINVYTGANIVTSNTAGNYKFFAGIGGYQNVY